MPNYLKMPKQQHVIALLELGWSYRRMQAETGVRRETVGRYDRARQANAAKAFPGSEPPGAPAAEASLAVDDPNAAKTFAGSAPNPAKVFPGSTAKRSRFEAAVYRTAVTEKLDAGLSLSRRRPRGRRLRVLGAALPVPADALMACLRTIRQRTDTILSAVPSAVYRWEPDGPSPWRSIYSADSAAAVVVGVHS